MKTMKNSKNNENAIKMGNYLKECSLVILAKEWNNSIETITSKITFIITDKLSYASWWYTSIERLIEIKHKFENGQRLLNHKFDFIEFKSYKIFRHTIDTMRKLAHEPPCDVLMSYSILLDRYKIKDFAMSLVCELCNEIVEKYEHRCDCSVVLEISLDWFGSQNDWERAQHDSQ